MLLTYLPVFLILAAGMLYAIAAKKLTTAAAVCGAMIGLLIFVAMGYTGLAMMTTFFVLGTAATSWKRSVKQQYGLVEENKGRRTTGQVLANAGLAGLLAVLVLLDKDRSAMYNVMIASVFAAATADTLSSELGNIYGRRFFNSITLKKDERGLNGVVSLEGTLIGIAGSLIIALIYGAGFTYQHTAVIVIAGTVGNLCDSVLGATVERKGLVNNNVVNFLNTVVAGLTGYGVWAMGYGL